MPVLVTGIHANTGAKKEDVDGRDRPGHDESERITYSPRVLYLLHAQISASVGTFLFAMTFPIREMFMRCL